MVSDERIQTMQSDRGGMMSCTYEDQIEFRRSKFREWYRLNPPSRKAKRRPRTPDMKDWWVLIRLDKKGIELAKRNGTLEIIGPRQYKINLD